MICHELSKSVNLIARVQKMADSSGVAELMTVPGSKAEWLY
jgi:hypothetical protein